MLRPAEGTLLTAVHVCHIFDPKIKSHFRQGEMQRLVFVFANLILHCSCARIVRQVKDNVETQVHFGEPWFRLGLVWDGSVQQDHRLILGLLSLPRQSGPVQQRFSQACGRRHHQGGVLIVMRNINEKI